MVAELMVRKKQTTYEGRPKKKRKEVRFVIFSSPGQCPGTGIVLPPALALASASGLALALRLALRSALTKCSSFAFKFLRSHSF